MKIGNVLSALAVSLAIAIPSVAGATMNPPVGGDTVGNPNCIGNGTDGKRVQAVYVHESGVSMSAAEQKLIEESFYAASLYASENADGTDVRRLRYVHGGNCAPTIIDLQVADTEVSGGTIIDAGRAAGHTSTDRKYAYFVENNPSHNAQCVATQANHEGYGAFVLWYPEGSSSWNGCWNGNSLMHEYFHSDSFVQNTAPHWDPSSPQHVTDGYDLMAGDPDTFGCALGSGWVTIDCGRDDYFDTQPASGSYLASNPNAANSPFFATSDYNGCRVHEEPDISRNQDRMNVDSDVYCPTGTGVSSLRLDLIQNGGVVKTGTPLGIGSGGIVYSLSEGKNNCTTSNNDKSFWGRVNFLNSGGTLLYSYDGPVETFGRNCN